MKRNHLVTAFFGKASRPRGSHRRRTASRGSARTGELGLQRLEDRLALAAPDLARMGPATADGLQPTPAAVTIGAATYFVANDGVHGAELWRTTGTAAGTVLVRDLNPGAAGSDPSDLTAIGNTLYFLTSSTTASVKTWTLWRSDGSGMGTTPVKSVTALNDDQAPGLTAAGSILYFRIHSGVGTHQLWRSDGTPGGTWVLKTFVAFNGNKETASPAIGPLTAVGSRLYFQALDTKTVVNGRLGYVELWKTDGTVPSTSVIGGTPLINGLPDRLVSCGQYLYFQGYDYSTGNELWRSDGTGKGTFRLKDIRPGAEPSSPSQLTAVGSTLYFTADDGVSGRELWKTSGGALDTVRVKDINPGAAGSSVSDLTAVGSTLYFTASDGVSGLELWKTDAAAGAVMVNDPDPAYGSLPNHLVPVGGTLYFAANDGATGWQVWKTNGTAALTTRVTSVSGGVQVCPFAANGQNLLFTAADTLTGRELWKTDGTPTGSALVKDINTTPVFTGPTSFSKPFISSNVWLAADGPEAGLWVTDRTAPRLGFQKVVPGTAKLFPQELTTRREYVSNGVVETAYFSAAGAGGRELYKGTGTTATLVRDINPGPAGSFPKSLTIVHEVPSLGLDRLYFVANDGVSGEELWTSGGTYSSTVRVKDIRPGAGSSFPAFLTAAGPNLYFQAYDDAAGTELWKSDGTDAGTVRVKDIAPGPLSAKPSQFTAAGGSVFFTADDGASGVELWKTDGTAGGTVRVKDIAPGKTGSAPRNLVAVGSMLYFVANDGVSGDELWKSDGTAPGTVRVKDIVPGPNGSAPTALTAGGALLYFAANDGTTGQEPWVSDGSAAGTRLLRDVFPGAAGSAPASFSAVGSSVFFAANDGVAGRELWQTDGTLIGTTIASDIRPGSASSNPDLFRSTGSALYFTATGGPITSTPSVWGLNVLSAVPELPQPAPGLALASGVDAPVSKPEATQAGGLVTVSGTLGNTIAVSFMGTTNGQPDVKKIVNKYVTGQGAALLSVGLQAADLPIIGDGLVYVVATQYDKNGKPSQPAVISFMLDTVPPAAPLLALGPGLGFTVPVAQATQPAGIVTIQGIAGLTTAVGFSGTTNGQIDPKKLVMKYATGKGPGVSVAITLTAADLAVIGTGAVLATATQYDAAGNPSNAVKMWLTIV